MDIIKLNRSKTKAVIMLLGSTLFFSGNLWLTKDPEKVIMGYLGATLFGLGIIMAIVELRLGSSYLLINEKGFMTSYLYRKHFTAWKDVDHFFIIKINLKESIGYNYSSHYKIKGKKIARLIAGAESLLANLYNVKTTELLNLLNTYHMKYS